MVTRDHMDLGSSICSLGAVGTAHHFHSRNCDPDASRHRRDDVFTTDISWPNYHSGANGDFQRVSPVGAIHPVSAGRAVRDRTHPLPAVPSARGRGQRPTRRCDGSRCS